MRGGTYNELMELTEMMVIVRGGGGGEEGIMGQGW
jgi:hypothetical protein